ncbi:MAG TPA: DUF488 domain-containing protein [Croceibacterium sp.]|nr:DUF488 domain-containing protein [Croceibacterium sp.]
MAERETHPVFTVGHSTRTIEEFVTLLRAGQVSMVVDVRTIPRSRTNPQYNLDQLPDALARYQVGHRYIAALGGLRGRSAGVDPVVNALWRNRSFHNYADHALSPAFREGLGELLRVAAAGRCAVMCSEAVWWRCHRRIIADHLIARGHLVLHLMGPARVEPARLTDGAVADGGRVTYPAPPETSPAAPR